MTPLSYIADSAVLADGVQIAEPCYIGPHCIVGMPGFQHADWTASQFAAPARKPTIFGPNSRLVGLAFIGMGTRTGKSLRADAHSYIGEDCVFGDNVILEYGARVYDRVEVGDGATIGGFICNEAVLGPGCVVQGSLVHARTAPAPEPAPTIGPGAFIGTGALVIGGVFVAPQSFVAAGAVLSTDTESGYLYRGVPARKVRRLEWH
jgi:acetyltransferase-like isoleucine patch superfamily enzyme